METTRSWRKRLLLLTVVIVASSLMPIATYATGAISQGFTTADTSLPAGTLMGLKSNSANVVEKATSDRAYVLMGVSAAKPLVALGDGTQQVQIVVSGITPALVSNINGDIKIGDHVTASPIMGVGMKAQASTQVVGIAQSNLSDSKTTTQTVTDKTGKSTEIKVGLISVQVNVSYYDAPNKKLNSVVPAFLTNLSNSIAGKEVSPLRILIGFGGLLIGFILTGIMLQAAIRSGIISIGRNPLAQASVRKSIIDVLLTALGILLISGIAFYLTLTV